MPHKSLNVLLIVPTGIGAAIGGYAGDALPVARALAAVADNLITHPNVLNGASLYWPLANVWYVEGFALDQVAIGNWGLRPRHFNRLGVVLDRAIEPDLALRHRQVIDAAKATLGIDISGVITTDQDLGIELRQGESGISWGTIANPDALLRAAELLIKQFRAEAIAVVARFPDDMQNEMLQQYRQGQGVDALAGAEAVISHLISRELQLPCAHAPALLPLPLDPTVCARSAAEELGYTFLPCVLAGLSRAPQIITRTNHAATGDLWAEDIDVAIAPYDACGSPALLALAMATHQPRLIFVRENSTVLQVPPESLALKGIVVASYLEAIGAVAALKAGVNPEYLHAHSIAYPDT
ncbi:DUF3326 domain-containing protein [Thalassoporum mexicanum]|uniref:DUF3326 domain-containing protein n=1 Tax=Thalassoporum mexicanum TaxID=3457544 RepID=UPI0005A22F24